jgi:class 3 adenylate cyclase
MIAYQVLGDGPIDLLFCAGLGSHCELVWEVPAIAAALSRLSSFCRLIHFDRRGTGASDDVPHGETAPSWEMWTEDIEAVMVGAGCERAAILASLDAGAMTLVFAATHPERVHSLVFLNSTASYSRSDEFPVGIPPEAIDSLVARVRSTWGTTEMSALVAPTMAEDPEFLRLFARSTRGSATPLRAASVCEYTFRWDARQALPLIHAPTLVINTVGNPMLPVIFGRDLADHIEGARFLEDPSGDLILTPSNDWIIDEIGEFLTGERPEHDVDRVLATILFSDIVRSTERVAELGDQRWRALLDAHDREVREHLRRFRGREIKTVGDGFVASFDGPARAIHCALAMTASLDQLGLPIRVGLHTGECDVRGDDLGGLAVHIASRVSSLAQAGETLVSGTVRDLVVGSGIQFSDRGEHDLRGVPGTWKLFAVR